MYANRSRFIPNSLTRQFEQRTWPQVALTGHKFRRKAKGAHRSGRQDAERNGHETQRRSTRPSLDDILARPDVWSADQLATATIPTVSSHYPTLNAELPGGGWPRGALTEILTDRTGLGECSLLMPAFAQMHEDERWSLLVAPPHRINAPAWAATGIDLSRLATWFSPTRPQDVLWAAEHALSSGAFGAVACWKSGIDARQVRRLQVAVAGHNTLAFLFRPARETSNLRRRTAAAAIRRAGRKA